MAPPAIQPLSPSHGALEVSSDAPLAPSKTVSERNVPDFSLQLPNRYSPTLRWRGNTLLSSSAPTSALVSTEQGSVPVAPLTSGTASAAAAEPETPSPDLSLTVGGSAELYGAVHVSDEPTNVPLSGFGTLYIIFNANDLAKGKIDLALTAKMAAGFDTYRGDEGSILGGLYDRFLYLRSRFNLIQDPETGLMDNHIGITKLNGVFKYKPAGVSLFTGISMQDEYVYPYNFNSTMFSDGTVLNTSRAATADGPAWSALWLTQIGIQSGLIFEPTALPGVKFVFMAGPEGGFRPSSSWSMNGQVGYTKDYPLGGLKASTTVAAFGMGITKPSEENLHGEALSDRAGGGFFAGQTLGPVTLGVGFAANTQQTGEITTTSVGTNAAATVQIADRAAITAAWTNFSTDEKAFPYYDETSALNTFELGGVLHFPELPGFGIYAGYNGGFGRRQDDVSSTLNGNQHFGSVGITYGGSHTFDLNP